MMSTKKWASPAGYSDEPEARRRDVEKRLSEVSGMMEGNELKLRFRIKPLEANELADIEKLRHSLTELGVYKGRPAGHYAGYMMDLPMRSALEKLQEEFGYKKTGAIFPGDPLENRINERLMEKRWAERAAVPKGELKVSLNGENLNKTGGQDENSFESLIMSMTQEKNKKEYERREALKKQAAEDREVEEKRERLEGTIYEKNNMYDFFCGSRRERRYRDGQFYNFLCGSPDVRKERDRRERMQLKEPRDKMIYDGNKYHYMPDDRKPEETIPVEKVVFPDQRPRPDTGFMGLRKEYKSIRDADKNDGEKHRELSCRLDREICPGAALVLGGGKEMWDIAKKVVSPKNRENYTGVVGILQDSMKDMANNLRGSRNQFYFPDGDCESMSRISEGVDEAKFRAFPKNAGDRPLEHLKKFQESKNNRQLSLK